MNISEMTKGLKEETKKKIKELIKLNDNDRSTSSRERELSRLVDDILQDIFDTGFSFLIPREFLDTKLGILLFSIKYSNEYYYTTFDMEIILDRVKSNLYFHRNQGHLKLVNHGGGYEATERSLREFMNGYVGLSQEEIDHRFDAFWEVKNSYFPNKLNKKNFKEQFELVLSRKNT